MLTPLAAGDPRRIGPFEIHNRIGAGGMGSVYLGFNAEGRAAAVKVPAEGLASDPEFRARFRREVEAARRVRGRSVAAVVDADPDAASPWMAVEYVEGTSLSDAVIRHGPLEQRLLHTFGVGLADALVAIHAVGVVHRDLKPSNILLAWDGPKVIDFGIARASGTPTHTRTGILVGTPAWMAPEQLRGERAKPAADVFAWGACVTYAATGHPPFGGAEPADVLTVLSRDEQPDLEGVPADLLDAVKAALARRPEDRPTAAELVETLVRGPGAHGAPDLSRAAANALTPWQWSPSPKPGRAPAAGAADRPAEGPADAAAAGGPGRLDGAGRPVDAHRAAPAAAGDREPAGGGSPARDRPTQPLAVRPEAGPTRAEEPPGGDSSLGTVPVPRMSVPRGATSALARTEERPAAGATDRDRPVDRGGPTERDGRDGAGAEGWAWLSDPQAWLKLLTSARSRDRAVVVAAVVAFGLVVGAAVLLAGQDGSRAESEQGVTPPGPPAAGATTSPTAPPRPSPSVLPPPATARSGSAGPRAGSTPPPATSPDPAPHPTQEASPTLSPPVSPTQAVSPTPDASASPSPDASGSATPCAPGARPEGLVGTPPPEPC